MSAWLWEELRYLFEANDGTLPEVNINFMRIPAVPAAYQLLFSRARTFRPVDAKFWSILLGAEQNLESVPNPAALVASYQAEPFHIVLVGINSKGLTLPDIGLYVFQETIALDWRMGDPWNPSLLDAFFHLLNEIASLDNQCSLTLREVPLEGEDTRRFQTALDQWRRQHAA